ncbi:3-phenylpropionate MFS transporter [Enterovibrio nigricans]|nr:3-phenylpropionate MFS transporter [Enterovibrio nigricans]
MNMFRPSPFSWLSIYYGTFFFAYGVYLPFWSVWLAYMGLSADDIGIVIGAGVMTRFVMNLAVTPRFHLPTHLLPALRAISFVGALFGFLHLAATPDLLWLTVLSVLINCSIGPSVPISDALANHYNQRNLLDYGKTRLWGSLAFVLGSTVTGRVAEHFGPQSIIVLAAVGLLATGFWTLLSPSVLPLNDTASQPVRPKLSVVIKSKEVLTFVLLVSLIQGSHAAYYAFSSVHWIKSGISDSTVGYLWSIGVVVEVTMFAFSRRLFGHWAVQSLFRLAALAVIVRWGLTGWSTDVGVLVFAQSLHGVTFGLAHIAAMRYIQHQPSDKLMAMQALYNAIPLGAAMAILTMVSGMLYSWLQGDAFYVMAALGIPALFLTLPKNQEQNVGVSAKSEETAQRE